VLGSASTVAAEGGMACRVRGMTAGCDWRVCAVSPLLHVPVAGELVPTHLWGGAWVGVVGASAAPCYVCNTARPTALGQTPLISPQSRQCGRAWSLMRSKLT
jgi:hypothetical protein